MKDDKEILKKSSKHHYCTKRFMVICVFTRNEIRNYEEYKDEFFAMGFDSKKDQGDFVVLYEALKVYKIIYGHLEVPFKWHIKAKDIRYPEEGIRGKNLGSRVNSIRHLNSYRRYRKELLAIGMTFCKPLLPFHKFKEALLLYKTNYMEIMRFLLILQIPQYLKIEYILK